MTDETPQTENEAAGGQSRAGEAGANLTDGLGTFVLVAYRREWDGDESDLGQFVYTEADGQLDNYGVWEPLYAWVPNA